MVAGSRARSFFRHLLLGLGIVGIVPAAQAVEVVVQNDSLTDGSPGIIQAGFDPGESGAAWLTSPCDGSIVAVRVFWRSTTGLEPFSIEDSIKIFESGVFPSPGTELTSIDGPVMTDSVVNEFRFLDENMTIPLIVPVTNGQRFVVSFKFLNDPSIITGPSLVNDLDGCQSGRNAIDATGLGWIDACIFIGGDWVIRAVVECGGAAGGPGSVPNGGDTPGQPLRIARASGSQITLSWDDSCSGADNDYEIYRGFMGAYYSHFSQQCSTAGLTEATFTPDNFDRYYLVVPTDGSREGSYGRDSLGSERPQGGGACETLQAVTCPTP